MWNCFINFIKFFFNCKLTRSIEEIEDYDNSYYQDNILDKFQNDSLLVDDMEAADTNANDMDDHDTNNSSMDDMAADLADTNADDMDNHDMNHLSMNDMSIYNIDDRFINIDGILINDILDSSLVY